ncbi:hypothetical protein ACVGVM_24290 [Pseudonocardia bannensis]|uniref:Uncharacterized protein n=1 Tax=Pseudonocardia bannensis TaxID=630973 RepID=A0A848DG99_9PSEU|nr:hypothetical protein [Pseudonocardia bannensis]NMH91563.1 hypothetical protein [Pseudonocardia bannensis]
MAESHLRVFVDDGPRGGEWVTIEPGPGGAPPPRIQLLDPVSAEVVDDEIATPLPQTERTSSTYELSDVRQPEGGAVYRFAGPGEERIGRS